MIDSQQLNAFVGSRIKEFRQNQDATMTQADLADKVGLKRTSITNIENGKQSVPLSLLYSICHVLSIDITSVLPNVERVLVVESLKENFVKIGVNKIEKQSFEELQEILRKHTEDKD